MHKIKRIEIRDTCKQGFLIDFPEILDKIENQDGYQWGVLSFDAFYYAEEAQPIANYITKKIQEKK